jgi:hypothetical protein
LFHDLLSPRLSLLITKSNIGKSFSAQPTCRANPHHLPCKAVGGTVGGTASLMWRMLLVDDGVPSADGCSATATVAPKAIKLIKLAMIRFNNLFS